jgi:diguanylate cyclase (GGDEF)-like protein
MDVSAADASPPTILVVEDDRAIANMLQATLQLEGYSTAVARSGEEGLSAALRDVPELILLDLMLPGIDGFAVLRQLRANPKSEHIPVIVLSARHDTMDKVRAFKDRVDDYLTKPFNGDELMARIRARLRPRNAHLNPLSGLPAGPRIEQAITHQLQSGRPWALLYFDLDNFKAYNDAYGPFKGDEMIKLMGRLAIDVAREWGNPADFVGHFGGDDFMMITTPDRILPLCRALVERWDRESRTTAYYAEADLARGSLYAKDRNTSNYQYFPLVGVSIGVVTNQRRSIDSIEEVSKIAAEVKGKAKLQAGSSYYIDQRATPRDQIPTHDEAQHQTPSPSTAR